MSAGLLAIYSFGGSLDLYPLLYYGLKAMANRGDVAIAYVHDGGDVRKIELDLAKEDEKRRATGRAAVGCVHVEDCCREMGEYIVCSFGPERVAPSQRPDKTAYVALSRSGDIYAYRPPRLWHMAVGAYGFDFAIVATETAAVEVLGGEVRRSLKGGELLRINELGVESSGGGDVESVCAMEYIYVARPDSRIDGREVAEARAELAKRLAKKAAFPADVVVGVPETGVYYAAYLASELGKGYRPAFVATARGRSALLEEIGERIAVIQLKANVVESSVKGMRVLVVDDSIISGVTLRQIAQQLRGRAGAREVYAAIASPPLVSRCPYGVVMPQEGRMIFRKLASDEVARALELDGLAYLDVADLKEAIKTPICTRCFLSK
ncbi:MAG: phosphoribosyltransferase family protein [Thermoproteus sp.]